MIYEQTLQKQPWCVAIYNYTQEYTSHLCNDGLARWELEDQEFEALLSFWPLLDACTTCNHKLKKKEYLSGDNRHGERD